MEMSTISFKIMYVAIGFIVNSWSELRLESRILNESPCTTENSVYPDLS